MTDFPDWQQFPNAQSDNLFSSFTQNLPPGTHSTPVLPALSWSSIMIAAGASAGAGQIQLNHFADAAATQQIDSDNWPFNSATQLRVRSPLRGKYVRIDTIVTSAGNLTGNFWANFLSASSDRISFPVSQQNLSAFNLAVPASGTVSARIGEICAGQAQWYFNPYDTSGKLHAYTHAVDENGNPGQLIADYGTPTTLQREIASIPDLIVEVVVTNTDAAGPHTFDFSLTVPPQ